MGEYCVAASTYRLARASEGEGEAIAAAATAGDGDLRRDKAAETQEGDCRGEDEDAGA
jgi:hypothetical protein